MIILGWVAFAAIAYKVAHLERDYVDWDPFDILQIDRSSSQAEIKRAYRKLSLVYHPDKDTGDAKKFLQLTKAHAALTDDEARKNWEMYGNPDGPGAMSFGIALPSWIVEKENSLWVLGLYALVFMVTLPTVVGIWWRRSIKFGDDQVLLGTTRMYYYFVSRTSIMNIKRLLMILAASLEFYKYHNSEIIERPTDNIEVPMLMKEFTNFGEKNKEVPLCYAYSIKARALIFAHLSRLELNPNTLGIDKTYVVKKCPFLVHDMVQSIYQILTLALSGHVRQRPSLEMLENCMRLSPMVVQALWENKCILLQLPHIKEDMLRHFAAKSRHVRTIHSLAALKESERRLMLRSLTDDEYENVMSVCGQMPHVEIETKAEVLGDVDPTTITAGAVVTLTVTLKRWGLSEFFAMESAATMFMAAEQQQQHDDEDRREEGGDEDDAEQKRPPRKPQPVWQKQKRKVKGGSKNNRKKSFGRQHNNFRKQQPQQQSNVVVQNDAKTDDEREQSKAVRRPNRDGTDDSDVPPSESDLDDSNNDSKDDSNGDGGNGRDSEKGNHHDEGGGGGGDAAAAEADDDDDHLLWKEGGYHRGKREKSLESRSKVSHTVHCPYFPEEKQEYWWLYVVDRKLHYIMTPPTFITDLVDEIEVQLKFPAPDKVGVRHYTVHLRSDSYLDCDAVHQLKLDVKEAKEIPPEDLKYGISEDENEDDDDDKAGRSDDSSDDAVAISDDDSDSD